MIHENHVVQPVHKSKPYQVGYASIVCSDTTVELDGTPHYTLWSEDWKQVTCKDCLKYKLLSNRNAQRRDWWAKKKDEQNKRRRERYARNKLSTQPETVADITRVLQDKVLSDPKRVQILREERIFGYISF